MDLESDNIATWLREHAAAASVNAVPHPGSARRVENWIFLPVRIEGAMGASERAEKL